MSTSTWRDAKYTPFLVAACLWWLVIIGQFLSGQRLSIKEISPVVDYNGVRCSDYTSRREYLYFPMIPSSTSLGSINDLNLDKGVCVSHCPTLQDEQLNHTLSSIIPLEDVERSCGKKLVHSRLYSSRALLNYICLPSDEKIGQLLIKRLHLNGFKSWAWVLAEQLSNRSIVLMSFSLIGAIGLCLSHLWWGLYQVQSMSMITVIYVPAGLTVFLAITYLLRPREDYILKLADTSIASSTMIALITLISGILFVIAVYVHRRRIRLAAVIISTALTASKNMPGLYILPIITTSIVFVLMLTSLLISGSLLIDRNLALSPLAQPRQLSTWEAEDRVRKALHPENWATITQEEEEQQQHLPPFSPHGSGFDLLGYPMSTEQQQTDQQPHDFIDVSPPPPPPTFTLSDTPQKFVNFPISTKSVIVYLGFVSSTLFLVETILALNQFLLATWACIWYFTVPDVSGCKVADPDNVKEATIRVFTRHFGTVVLLAALNAATRLIRTPFQLLSYLPVAGPYLAETSKPVRAMESLINTVSGTTVAECLLHGFDMVTSAQSILTRPPTQKAVGRLFRLAPLAAIVPVQLIAPVLGALIALGFAAISPLFTQPSSPQYIASRDLCATVAFVMSFYMVVGFTSSLLQISETIVCCYQLERSDRSHSMACTPEVLTVISSEVNAAAVQMMYGEGSGIIDPWGDETSSLEQATFKRNRQNLELATTTQLYPLTDTPRQECGITPETTSPVENMVFKHEQPENETAGF